MSKDKRSFCNSCRSYAGSDSFPKQESVNAWGEVSRQGSANAWGEVSRQDRDACNHRYNMRSHTTYRGITYECIKEPRELNNNNDCKNYKAKRLLR